MHAFCKSDSVLGCCLIVRSLLPSNKRKQSGPLLCNFLIVYIFVGFYIKPTAGRKTKENKY